MSILRTIFVLLIVSLSIIHAQPTELSYTFDATADNFKPDVPVAELKPGESIRITLKGNSNAVTTDLKSGGVASTSQTISPSNGSATFTVPTDATGGVIVELRWTEGSVAKSQDIPFTIGSSSDRTATTAEDFFRPIFPEFGSSINSQAAKDHYYVFFDEFGQLLNDLPAYMDADDQITIYVRVLTKDRPYYRILKTEGEYAPSDLSLRIPDKLAANVNSASDADFTYISSGTWGPFTSAYFKFDIVNARAANGGILSSISIPIHSLYHAGFGASLVASTLQNPQFKTVTLSNGVKTIVESGVGNRTIMTINAIWYWRIFSSDFWKGRLYVSGRDIFTEEPFYERLYPTVGVGLTESLTENYFVGLTWEFARGGSVIVGTHFGKVRQLADRSFVLGVSPFTGSDGEIVTTDYWWSRLFYGVTIDTRVINALFGLRK